MKKKMILLISIIQIMALSACGNTANVTPMETDNVQTRQPENFEENIIQVEAHPYFPAEISCSGYFEMS